MIELVTQAYMLLAPVGVGIVLYCIVGLAAPRRHGGYSGAAIVDPAKVRAPSSPSGVQRIGDYKTELREWEAAMERWREDKSQPPPPPPPVNPECLKPATIRRSVW